MNRRDFLTDLTCAAAFAATVPNVWRVTRRPRFADDPFQLGVASGDPTSTGAVLWTRLAPRPLDPEGGMNGQRVVVRWEVAEDDGFRTVVRQGRATAAPDLSYSIHVDVDGLSPDRWYHYRFRAGDATSPTGRLRTTPLGTAVSPLRFGRVVSALRGRTVHRVRTHGARGARPRHAPRRLYLRVRRFARPRPSTRRPRDPNAR